MPGKPLPSLSPPRPNGGYARVYQISHDINNNTTSCTQLHNDLFIQNLTVNTDSGGRFGLDLNLTSLGDAIVVTSKFIAIVYTIISNTWTSKGTNNVASGFQASGDTGASNRICINDSATIVISGIPNMTNTNVTRFGRVRVINYDGTSWSPVQITPTTNNISKFGYGVDIHPNGDYMAISCVSNNDVGLVTIYNNLTGTPTVVGSNIQFSSTGVINGISVSLNGESNSGLGGYMLAIGSPDKNKVDFYYHSGGLWTSGPSIMGNLAELDFGKNVVVAGDINITTSTFIGVGSRSNAIVYTLPTICFHKSAKIMTKSGNKYISELRGGDTVYDNNGNVHDVIKLVRLPSNNKYVLIKQNALGNNMPHEDLYISEFHPLYINGEEIPAKNLVNNIDITKVYLHDDYNMYTILTKERLPINVNGLYAMTWKDDEFYEYANNKLIFYELL